MPRQSGGGMPYPGRPGGAPIKYVGAPRQSGGGALIQSGGGVPSPRRFGGGCLKKGRFKRFRPVREMWVSKRRRKKKYMRRSYNPINAMDGLRRGDEYTFHDFVHWWPVHDRTYIRIYKYKYRSEYIWFLG